MEEPIEPKVNSEQSTVESLVAKPCCSKCWKLGGLVVGLLIVVGLFANAYLMFSKKNTSVETSNTSVITTPTLDSTAGWKTYQDEIVSFKYPSSFTQEPILIRGSGYTQEFSQKKNGYTITFSFLTSSNYNNGTGKPFISIDDYVGLSYQTPTLLAGGLEGRQTLPRAGSENDNQGVFFSKDSKNIYTFDLQVGDYSSKLTDVDIKDGQKLFTQILSTFRFD